jgi:hypothetical protein
MGEVNGKVEDKTTAENITTKVVGRFTEKDWKQDGEYISITYTLKDVDKDSYIRLRGTNTDQLEPVADPRGEDPWTDLLRKISFKPLKCVIPGTSAAILAFGLVWFVQRLFKRISTLLVDIRIGGEV